MLSTSVSHRQNEGAMGTFEFSESGEGYVELAIDGVLDASRLKELEAAVDAWPAAAPPPALLLDLRRTDRIEQQIRVALVDVHRALKAKAGRSVYLAESPVLRGMALWILHLAGDQRASVVGSLVQARAWLTGSEGRVASWFDALGKPRLPMRAEDGPLPDLSLKERMVSRVGGFFTRVTQGYWLAFLEELIRTFGVEGLEQIGEQNEEILGDLTQRWNAETAQIVVGMGALWNGCGYCGVGHIYAANLLYFRRTGELLPLDEREVPRLQRWTDNQVLEALDSRFTGPLEPTGALVRRQYALKFGGDAARDEADALLLRACAAWDIVNECSIVVQLDEVPPLHPAMAKARGVQRSYRARRRASRANTA